jgi:hypothetical protein
MIERGQEGFRNRKSTAVAVLFRGGDGELPVMYTTVKYETP